MVTGYACPVCDIPQQDGVHLANHLAFTAVLHEAEHHEWLESLIPEWQSMSPEELAEITTEHAGEIPFETVFDDTTDLPSEPDHPPIRGDAEHYDETTKQIIEDTRSMMRNATQDNSHENDS